jgi:hypothetical protein
VRQSAKGTVRDPESKEVLSAPYYDQAGKLVRDWEMGHLAGHEWWRALQTGSSEGYSWQKMTEIYNDPSHYFPESAESNRSHESEDTAVWILQNGTKVGR